MPNQTPTQQQRITVRYKTIIEIPQSCIRAVRCVMPSADELMNPTNPARAGLVRHGALGTPINHVPMAYKHPYGIHVQDYLKSINSLEQRVRRAILLLGSRNSFQNLLLPLWIRGQLLCRPDEPWRSTIYTALCKLISGISVIQKIRFRESNGNIIAVGENREAVEWAVTGQPLLFRGEIPPLSLLAAMTYDQRHVFHLLWEGWQTELFPEFAWHKEAHDELMEAFMRNLSQDVKVRAAALWESAARRGLQIEEGYLHSSLGLRQDGSLISVMMTGSLHDHGRLQRELGAESAVLLDNGGSVSAAYWSAKDWQQSAFEKQNPPQPVFFGGGSYFRDAALTTLLFDLNADILEEPFCPRPPGDEPWVEW
jgi:hypothetical protein